MATTFRVTIEGHGGVRWGIEAEFEGDARETAHFLAGQAKRIKREAAMKQQSADMMAGTPDLWGEET